MPSEEEQFSKYKHVLEAMGDEPVVIRAIRSCLENEDVFNIQLRALLRASIDGNLRIMFPMISNIREICQAKTMIASVKEGIAYGDFQVGIMVEIHAAALIADQLAKEVDFFSIASNDLIQMVIDAGKNMVSG